MSGVPIMDGLDIVARTAGNKIVEEAIYGVRQAISEGKTIAEPLAVEVLHDEVDDVGVGLVVADLAEVDDVDDVRVADVVDRLGHARVGDRRPGRKIGKAKDIAASVADGLELAGRGVGVADGKAAQSAGQTPKQNGSTGGGKTPGPYLPKTEDNTRDSLMSYNTPSDATVADSTDLGGGKYSLSMHGVQASTYQMDDIEALQYMYGRSPKPSQSVRLSAR